MGEGEDGGESDIERAARGEGERGEGCDGRGWRGEASCRVGVIDENESDENESD